MTRRLFWSLFLVLFCGVVLADWLAWSVARPDRNIGAYGDPLDDVIEDRIGPQIQRQKLKKQFVEAATPEAAAEVGQLLFRLLGEMGKTDERVETMGDLIHRFPDADTKVFRKIRVDLAKLFAKRRNAARLRPLLEDLLARADTGERTNTRRILEILEWARQGGADDFFVQLAEKSHTRPVFTGDRRYRIASMLVAYYEEKGLTDKLKAARALLPKYRKHANIGKLVTARTRKLNKLFKASGKQRDYATPLQALRQAYREFPDHHLRLRPYAFRFLLATSRARDLDTARAVFDLIEPTPPPTNQKLREIARNAVWHYMALLMASEALPEAEKADHLRALQEWTRTLFPDDPDMYAPYLPGEIWARSGREGPSPKKLHTVPYIENAGIELDGELSEDIYRRVPSLPGPWWVNTDNKLEDAQDARDFALDAKVWHDGSFVYFGIRCPEPRMRDIRSEKEPGQNKHAWEDDGIEIFLDYDRDLTGWHQWIASNTEAYTWYQLDLGNPYVNGSKAHAPREDTASMACASARHAKNYTIEIMIPVSNFADGPIHGKLVNFNLRRLRYSAPAMVFSWPWNGKKTRVMTISWGNVPTGHQPRLYPFVVFE